MLFYHIGYVEMKKPPRDRGTAGDDRLVIIWHDAIRNLAL